MSYAINLEVLPWDATVAILNLDKSFVGTPNYMGVAYFWAHEYKHLLRGATISQRRRIHNKALGLGLDFCEVGVKQWELIGRVLRMSVEEMIGKKYYKKLKEAA